MPLKSSKAGFSAEARLRTPAEFNRVFKTGLRTMDTCFCMYASRNETGHARLGITVARKAAPGAVVRNRIKRQVRENFRSHRAILPAVDIVVQARPPAAAADNPGLRDSLEWHWQELKKRCAVS
ncbi:MAG: ribonuclease P protein component [Gammaproteobacteria bacterium]